MNNDDGFKFPTKLIHLSLSERNKFPLGIGEGKKERIFKID